MGFTSSQGSSTRGTTALPCSAISTRLPRPGTYPALVLVHGGAWQRGSRDSYVHWGPYLAEHGYVAFAIDYRLTQPEQPPIRRTSTT